MLNARYLMIGLLWLTFGIAPARAGIAQDLAAGATGSPWQLFADRPAASPEGAIEPVGMMRPMAFDKAANRWQSGDASWQSGAAGLTIRLAASTDSASAAYTVSEGAAGFYSIRNSLIRLPADSGRGAFRVFVRRNGESPEAPPAVYTFLSAGDEFEFDSFCGYLNAGDQVFARLAPGGDKPVEAVVDFDLAAAKAIPVSRFFRKGAGSSDAWSITENVPNSPAGRLLAGAGGQDRAGPVTVQAGSDTVVVFRVPQSGYYALHDAIGQSNTDAEARLYVGRDTTPRRVVRLKDAPAALNADLGYIPRGERVYIAFSASKTAAVRFNGTIIEWAPRRAPLRVTRSAADGLLDVLSVESPDVPTDLPADRWINVPPVDGDATEAIRNAIARAKSLAGDGWAGVRLQAGATYPIATTMANGGNIFELRDVQRVILDGNGATLRVTSPEIQRRGFTLFATYSGTRDLVFHDLVVEAAYVPFTLGQIIDVNPRTGNSQTLTVKMEAGSVDPLKEISRDGRANAYVYDPLIPGRLAVGTWSHYPGHGDGPQVRPGSQPGTFTHALTRTGSSLNIGDKWLIKNKGGGLIYLATRGDSQNITLSKVIGRASGGGTLRFWTTSGINILDSRFEPDDHYWISSSADGVHGRAREGVWVENTVLRGVCEDIMNTYARTMAVAPDENPADDTVTLGVYENSVRTSKGPLRKIDAEDLKVGDRLVFFSPAAGKVLGYVSVLSIEGNRVKLTRPVQDAIPWTGDNPRDLTLVYSIDSVGNFVVRDSKFMDSMRVGIYIKAKGGVVWGNTIEGQSAAGVFATNEPEWPEGPPARHVWIQGNTFSQNNYGYMSRHRDYLVVDPADISIYTRRLRDPKAATDYEGHTSHGHFANDHVTIIGNTFHDWRGMGISVRNARNVTIRDNLFLAPIDDPVLRSTLATDPHQAADGRGLYSALFFDSVRGAQVTHNQSLDLPPGDRQIAQGNDVDGIRAGANTVIPSDRRPPEIELSFSEWFGDRCKSTGSVEAAVTLRGATHQAGRLGAGLFFNGKDAAATMAGEETSGPAAQRSVSLWYRADRPSAAGSQAIFSQISGQSGITLTLADGRLIARAWDGQRQAQLDFGPAPQDTWSHVAIVFDGPGRSLRGYVNGLEIAAAKGDLPLSLPAATSPASFGSLNDPAAGEKSLAPFAGMIDEVALFGRAITGNDIVRLCFHAAREAD